MAFSVSRVSVGTSAVLIHEAVGRTELRLRQESGTVIELGGAGVTSGGGQTMPTTFTIELSDGDLVYGVAPSGTTSVSVLAVN